MWWLQLHHKLSILELSAAAFPCLPTLHNIREHNIQKKVFMSIQTNEEKTQQHFHRMNDPKTYLIQQKKKIKIFSIKSKK